jgi:hypothetical protein
MWKGEVAHPKTPSLLGSLPLPHPSAFVECAAPPPSGGVGEGLLLSVGLGGVFRWAWNHAPNKLEAHPFAYLSPRR